jgi:hypothetical protein
VRFYETEGGVLLRGEPGGSFEALGPDGWHPYSPTVAEWTDLRRLEPEQFWTRVQCAFGEPIPHSDIPPDPDGPDVVVGLPDELVPRRAVVGTHGHSHRKSPPPPPGPARYFTYDGLIYREGLAPQTEVRTRDGEWRQVDISYEVFLNRVRITEAEAEAIPVPDGS